MLDIHTEEAGACTIWRPVGDLDAFSVAQLHHSLEAMASAPRLIIDLVDVAFVDTAGLGALISGIRGVRELGGEAAVACSHPTVYRVLHTSGLDRIVVIAASVEEAASALGTIVASPDDVV